MRVLVTGACGWTAAPIVEAVAQAGHEVYGFDLPDVPCNARTQARLSALMHGTIESAHDVDLAVQSVDAIIHLAVSIERDAYRSPQEPFAVNVLGTYNIFASALHHGVSKVVLMSEAAVHLLPHDDTLDARRDWRSAPDDDHLYDITKRLSGRDCQRLLRNLRHDGRIPACGTHRGRPRAGRPGGAPIG